MADDVSYSLGSTPGQRCGRSTPALASLSGSVNSAPVGTPTRNAQDKPRIVPNLGGHVGFCIHDERSGQYGGGVIAAVQRSYGLDIPTIHELAAIPAAARKSRNESRFLPDLYLVVVQR